MPIGLNLQGKTRASGDEWKASTDYPTPAYLGMAIRWLPADISDLESVQPLQSVKLFE